MEDQITTRYIKVPITTPGLAFFTRSLPSHGASLLAAYQMSVLAGLGWDLGSLGHWGGLRGGRVGRPTHDCQ